MGHKTQYLRPDDPHFPCDVVEARYLADCYFYQTSHMLRVFDGDFASVASECRHAPGTVLGNSASGPTVATLAAPHAATRP